MIIYLNIDYLKIKEWYKNGKLHREDGPAVERIDGTKVWYRKGKLHREDGPAIEYCKGNKEWWVNDKQYSEEDFFKKINSLNNKKQVNSIEKLVKSIMKIYNLSEKDICSRLNITEKDFKDMIKNNNTKIISDIGNVL